jgi:hypothetical protein
VIAYLQQRWFLECFEKRIEDNKDTEQNASLQRMRSALAKMIQHDQKLREGYKRVQLKAGVLSKLVGKASFNTKQHAEAKAAFASLMHDRASFTWLDSYGTKMRADKSLGRQRGIFIDPFMPSIEAAFPYVIWEDGYYAHVASNITVTAYYLNLAKSLFPPALLGTIAEYLLSDQSDEGKAAFMRKTDVLAEIMAKVPYAKSLRLTSKVDHQKMARDIKEWTEVILLPTKNQPWGEEMRTLCPGNSTHYHLDYRPPGVTRISKVVQEIEAHFSVVLPKKNGCPHFLASSGMPENWCWWMCWQLLSYRLARMIDWCSGKWETVDCIETIFLECVWQACDPTKGDLFNLPMAPWVRHPLRFAIAHEVRGRQMRTRWTKQEPDSINDRDDTLNNISIESAFTNFAKDNAPNDQYDDLKEDIKSFQVDAKWYNPTDRTELRSMTTTLSSPTSYRTKQSMRMIG